MGGSGERVVLRRVHRLGVLLVIAGMVLTMAPAAAAETDLRREQSEVRRRQAATASKVDVLSATAQQVQRSLQTLSANVKAEESKLADNRRAAAVAEVEESRLRQEVVDATKRLGELRNGLRDLAVRQYVRPLSLEMRTRPQPVAELARAEALLNAYNSKRLDIAAVYRQSVDDLENRRQKAGDAAQDARRRSLASQAQFRAVATARGQQQTFAVAAEARLESALAEAAALASLDRRLSAQIIRQQSSVAAGLKGSGTSGGRLSAAKVPLTTVHGITVASRIAPQVAALMDASAAVGLRLGGSGYRDSAEQVALRRAHCGPSNYDVYEKPASECSPPTARPGYSMHEQGLAIDFTSNGSLITSQSEPAFTWLAANAQRYGLSNLSSEPWHWSTTGG